MQMKILDYIRCNRRSIAVITVISASIIIIGAAKIEGHYLSNFQQTISWIAIGIVVLFIIIGDAPISKHPLAALKNELAAIEMEKRKNARIVADSELKFAASAVINAIADADIMKTQIAKHNTTFWIHPQTGETTQVPNGSDHDIYINRLRSNGYVPDNTH